MRLMQERPEYEFTTTDEVTHELWVITGQDILTIQDYFAEMEGVYIADCHHRSASSSGLSNIRLQSGKNQFENENYFLAFLMDER